MTARVRLARAARRARRTRTASAYGEPSSSGGPSGSTCHHDWPAAASQSTNRYASRPSRPPGSEVECSRTPLDRGSCIRFEVRRLAESLTVRDALRQATDRPGSRSRTSGRSRLRPLSRSSAPSATRSRSGRRSSATATSRSARRSATARPVARAGTRRRSSRSATTAGPARSTSTGSGRWQFTIEAWVDRLASCRDELRRKVEAGQTDLDERARRRARRCSASTSSTSRRRSPSTEADRLGGDAARPHARGRRRPRARALRRLVRALPALVGRLRRASRRCCPSSPSSASTSSTCRRSTRSARTNRKGRNNALDGASRATRAARGRSAAQEGGHDAIHPELGTIEDFDRLVARGAEARPRDRARLRDPVLARPPVAEGAPRVVPPPARRDAQVRREPAQALPGHLQRQLRQPRTGAGSGQALRDVVLHWVAHGVHGLPRRQPAHEAAAVLGVADRARCARVDPDVVFLAEAFTRPAMMTTLAKVGFSQSYTYFTWKNTKAELTEYLTELTARAGRSTSGRTSSRTRRTSSTSTSSAGGRPAFEARLVLAATLSPSYGIYSGYEHFENVPVRAGQRGVPRLGEVRGEAAQRSTGRCCRSSSG